MTEEEKEKQEQEKQEQATLFLSQKKAKPQQEAEGNSRISLQLTNSIAYDRTPSLFDPQEIQEKDRELYADIERLETEIELPLNKRGEIQPLAVLQRKEKPVSLTDMEARVVFALGYIAGKEKDDETIREIMLDPTFEQSKYIDLDIKALAKFINGTTRPREIDKIKQTILRLCVTEQVFPFVKWKDGKGRAWQRTISTPILRLGFRTKDELIDKSEAEPNEETEKTYIRVGLSRIFFFGLNNRFAILTPRLFEVWRTGKTRRGELFHVLLSSILSAFERCSTAAKKIEERLKEENKNLTNNKQSEAQLRKSIEQAQTGAWEYELSYDRIKSKVRTDYESEKQYRAKFKKDLQGVIEDFIKIGLITDRTRTGVKGRTGEKVIFYLNENYYKLDETKVLPPIEENKQLPPKGEET